MLLSLILSQALKNPEKSIPALRHSLQLLTLRYMTPLNIVTAAALVIKCSLLSLICTHINSQIARGDIDSLLPYCLSNHEAVTSASTFSFTTKYVMDPLYQVLLGAAGCCNKTHNQQLSHPCRPSCSRSQASIDCRSVTHHLIDWLNHRPHTTLLPPNYLPIQYPATLTSASSISWYLASCLLAESSLGLRNVRVTVPTAIRKGEQANLYCNYEMEDKERLYSIKWYKGKREFYRYTPQEQPSMKVFNTVSGVEVEVSLSVMWPRWQTDDG